MEKTSNKYSKDNLKRFIKISLWTYKQIFKLAPLDSILITVFVIVSSLLPLLNSFYVAKLTDALVKLIGSGITKAELLSINQPFIQLTLITTAIGLFSWLTRRLLRYYRARFRAIHLKRQEIQLTNSIAKLDIADFEDSKVHDEINKAKDNLYKLRDFVDSSYDFAQQVVQMIATGIILFKVSPLLGAFLILNSLPSGILNIIFVQKYYNFWDTHMPLFRKRGWTQYTLIDSRDLKQNRVSQIEGYLKNLLNKFSDQVINMEMAIRNSEVRFDIIISIINRIGDFIIPFVFIFDLVSGKISLGTYNFYVGRAYDFEGSFESILSTFSVMLDNSLGISHIKNLLDKKPKIISGNKRVSTKNPFKIEFKNVSFKYPSAKRYSIKNLNLTINPNEEIAIVGENGAGKTTIIKLILRLYDPTSGVIEIDGVDLRDIDLKSYYATIGTLFQDYSLYGMLSLKENITLGTSFKFNKQLYQKAIKQAQAEKILKELPLGDETLLSKEFPNGTQLSTGQRQKVALARMFYRNSPVLIFDEPTAAIDPQAEYKIFKKIYEFMNKKSVIIISHKFSTVKNAQKIYVMDKGQIIESGSHKELMNLNKVYADAYNKQAEGYKD